MSITYYSYPRDKDKVLSKHFKMGEFVSSSDYASGNYPSSVPIHDKLPEILEKVYDHFGATCGIICSGYRTPACDREVGGSGSGPHTIGIAVDVYYYKNGTPIPSRLISCYLQDIGIKGIGYKCGGNPNGTHFDMRGFGVLNDSFWHGDESKRDANGNYVTVSDYYKYTGTNKSEVYPNSNAASSSSSKQTTSSASSTSTSVGKKVFTTSQKMVDVIKTWEGLSLKACKAVSTEKYWTIGYGHYGAEVKANQTITEAEAEALLKSDLKVFENAVNAAVKVNITQAQFDACVSLAYNIGTGAFAKSDIVAFINAGKIGHACVDFPSWRLSGGQILVGLQRRRQSEMEFFGVGVNFILTSTMNVRSGPGTSYPIKMVAQITANGMECAVNKSANANALFKAGTVVTALELKAVYSTAAIDVWLRCPSGWICARQNKDIFIK